MKRKQFLKTVGASALGTAALVGCNGNGSEGARRNSSEIGSIGGRSLQELRDLYRADLFDDFLPSMEEVVIDPEYGGFICNVDIRTGEQLSTNKRAWYEGRGMWVYSYLYNYIEQDPALLEVARKSKDFILQNRPEGKRFWTAGYTREGEPLSEEEGDIYCNLFVAEGLAEYAQASGESEYFDQAKQLMLDAMDRYDEPDYSHRGGPAGQRLLGHWMVFLIASAHILHHREDPQIRQIADRSVDAILNHHLNSDYRLLNEYLEHDMSLPEEFAQLSYTGHGIETLWMVLYEAARRGDASLFYETAELFRRHVEVAQDAVYGGYFRSLDHVDNHTWTTDKVLWLQEEVLIGTMMMIEHQNDSWAKRVFAETEAYVREKFVRPDHKFWIISGDRKVEEYNPNRAGNYHHPRHLMMNLDSIERMIERNGRGSGLT